MADLIIAQEFLVSFPVFALPKSACLSAESAKLAFDGFMGTGVTSGNAIALFTDCDLAMTFLASEGPNTAVVLAKCVDCEALVAVLEIAKRCGSKTVNFDPPHRAMVHSPHCYGIDAVIESAKQGRS